MILKYHTKELALDIIERLENLEGTRYICDLALDITMNENELGYWDSEDGAVIDIKDNFEYIGIFIDNNDIFTNYDLINVFKKPEFFHCLFMITLYEELFWKMIGDSFSYSEIDPTEEVDPFELAKILRKKYDLGDFDIEKFTLPYLTGEEDI